MPWTAPGERSVTRDGILGSCYYAVLAELPSLPDRSTPPARMPRDGS
jgi:hypothetical protein